jgi:glycosyltransferase involved in cell wall biosynthesis
MADVPMPDDQLIPCVVIPTYENPETIERVVTEAQRYVADVIVVDDGSGPEAQIALQRLESRPDVDVVHRSENGGKGAAVKTGLARALERGFTHALQVDADGQHTLDDAPRMLEAAANNPAALVLGQPIFDDTAPKGRLWGRRISIFWVTLETLSRKIGDPMCGFRIYPVEAAVAAGARGNRMDFDPEIAVRMVWQGLEVINVPTQVRYVSAEEGGVSHFRMVRDNLAMAWMHSRLCVRAIFGWLFGRALRLSR